jgi:hypothetical protein
MSVKMFVKSATGRRKNSAGRQRHEHRPGATAIKHFQRYLGKSYLRVRLYN